MIVKEFNIEDIKLRYLVGINQIEIDLNQNSEFYNVDNEEQTLNNFFRLVEHFQDKNGNSMVQFIKDTYILNQDHIFKACYFLQKAFFYGMNISSKKNIEFLLYLSVNRQINKGIEAFGIDYFDLSEGKLTVCIISPINNLNGINNELLQVLNAHEVELTINNLSIEKYRRIKGFFEISDNQIRSVLNSYGINSIDVKESEINLNYSFLALQDLIFEKMALLNLEKTRIN